MKALLVILAVILAAGCSEKKKPPVELEPRQVWVLYQTIDYRNPGEGPKTFEVFYVSYDGYTEKACKREALRAWHLEEARKLEAIQQIVPSLNFPTTYTCKLETRMFEKQKPPTAQAVENVQRKKKCLAEHPRAPWICW